MDGWDIVVKIRSCYHNIMYNRKDDLESWRRQERLGEFLVKNVGTLSIIQKTTLKKQYFLICLILISILLVRKLTKAVRYSVKVKFIKDLQHNTL